MTETVDKDIKYFKQEWIVTVKDEDLPDDLEITTCDNYRFPVGYSKKENKIYVLRTGFEVKQND